MIFPNPHQVHATYRVGGAGGEAVAPVDRRRLAVDRDVLGLELGRPVRGERAPESQACLAPSTTSPSGAGWIPRVRRLLEHELVRLGHPKPEHAADQLLLSEHILDAGR